MIDLRINLEPLRISLGYPSEVPGRVQLRIQVRGSLPNLSHFAANFGVAIDPHDYESGSRENSPNLLPSSRAEQEMQKRKQLVNVKLYVSTDQRLDSNDVLMGCAAVDVASGRHQAVTLDYDASRAAVAPGSYYLIAKVDSDNQVLEGNEANNEACALVSAPETDPVIDWISCALNVVQAEGAAGRGVGPTIGTRMLALLSTAMYDTVNAFNDIYSPYQINTDAPRKASLQAAVVGAARRILQTFFPSQSGLIAQQFDQSLQEIKAKKGSRCNLDLGLKFGAMMADQCIALRVNDGSADSSPYSPPSGFGGYVWQPASSGPVAGIALGSNWGRVVPWAIDSVSAFAPDGLDSRPDRNSDLYAQQIEEVRLYGGLSNTARTTLLRSADQTQMAKFWAYDRPDTFRPYGQLNQIAMQVAVQQQTSLEKNASLFATLNTSLADSVIVAWDAKYKECQPRPSDIITGGFSITDGLDQTVHDPNWHSLLSSINGIENPPFPDYLSGHSAMGGAFAAVMTHFFGDAITFKASSQELPGVLRTFDGFQENGISRNSFYEAGFEDAMSRIYGGVHIREACEESFHMGLMVGSSVGSDLFGPIPTPPPLV